MYCLDGGALVYVSVSSCSICVPRLHCLSRELVAKSSNSHSGWEMMKERKAINWAVKIPSALIRAPRLQISVGTYCVWFFYWNQETARCGLWLQGRKVLFIYDAFFLGLSWVLWREREREGGGQRQAKISKVLGFPRPCSLQELCLLTSFTTGYFSHSDYKQEECLNGNLNWSLKQCG